jgi:glucokinase
MDDPNGPVIGPGPGLGVAKAVAQRGQSAGDRPVSVPYRHSG